MDDDVVQLFNLRKVERNLRRIRAKRFPACATQDQFENLLENNAAVQAEFGTFRGRDFYLTTLHFNGQPIMVFGITHMIRRVQRGCDINMDGTFNIAPLGFAQLFLVLATLEGKDYFI